MSWERFLSIADTVLAVAAAVFIVIGFAVLLSRIPEEGRDREYWNQREAQRREFIARCVEFHSAKRCGELFDYKRTDLVPEKGR